MKKRIIFLTLTCLALTIPVYADIASQLNWKPCPTAKGAERDLCHGYYAEPANIRLHPNPPPYKITQVTISAKGPVIFQTNGDSVLQKNVVISQPGREIHADKAIVRHDAIQRKITDVTLIGHVRVIESGKLLIGKSARYDIEDNVFTINNAVFHIAGAHELVSVKAPFDAWGSAKSMRHSGNVTTLKDATYSTCSPKKPLWVLSAKTLELDRNKNKGYAKNVVLRLYHIPIFYSPYFSYSLGGGRKSGLLLPTLGYATDHGFYAGIPYYWNMAPNYDLLFTPIWYSERGEQFNTLFRYLTTRSRGEIYASVIPNDRKFSSFKQNTLDSFAGKTLSPTVAPYIDELRSASTDRGYFAFSNDTTYNEHFKSDVELRYVTDPYFARDFSSEYLGNNSNQLPSSAELNYEGDHWNDTLLLQSYQTLHSLDHINTPAQNQYQRLPEFDVNGRYPGVLDWLDFGLSGQLVHFNYHSAFYPFTYQRPIGDRIHLQPVFSHSFASAGGYVKPALTLDSTSYFSQMPAASSNATRPAYNANRTLPILDVDSGLYFDRPFTLNHDRYLQTIEPRLFYLYTPYLNQDSYPNFDTQLLPFSFSDLFTRNRFTGFDRLQNANQLGVGLTSRVLSEKDASDILTAGLGLIGYFTNPKVCLLPGCTIKQQSISPITGSLTFNPSHRWSVTSDMAWDTSLHQINNAGVNTQFHLDNQHIAVLGYQFTHGNADTPFDALGFSTNSSLLTAGLVWPITDRLHFFGYAYYNLTLSHPEDEYIGFSYDTCCFAFRAIVQNNYDGEVKVDGGSTFQNRYTTNYFIEFLLKGLGSTGNHSAENLLTSTLTGFEDAFSHKSHYGYPGGI